MTIPLSSRLRWYQTTGGILLAGLAVLVALVAIIFLILVTRYYFEIKNGRGEILFQEVYGGFTGPVGAGGADAVTREQVESIDDPFLGNPTAGIVVVEFVDFKCPNCSAALPIMKQVLQKYGHKIKLIIRDFPVESTHPGAGQLAEIANCASEQGLYWVAHDWFYAHQTELNGVLSTEQIKVVAGQIGLDYNKLSVCLRQSTIKIEVNRDYVDGYSAGVRGTPTFFINGKKVEGVIPFTVWDKFLEKQ
ncbi:MAG: hypothetical protein A3J93_04675 [Candidatus Magasanikbacteria bacterium RIFOXYC2_FULL_42_28]|uniref:Thioredoxin domain-containing protein n=1 Tax=Candidatus Magasanikbacteria bacterium RIFOXYC2_FULL_42_28 TaxID=1798704 RepID=A0A1F6NWK5_9BACT|nr:MAG: hypothetical protein A3J93_04675 [Candidatus Magasanikbacteria bacterium RIFOXYC2_FULL_42_28]